MKKYKLSELFDLQMGKTPARNNPQFWDDGENPWISIADMSSNGKYIITTKECITDCAVRETGIKPIFPGTVIMSFKLSVGKVAIVRTPYQCYSNEAIIAFEINDNISSDDQPSSEYIYYLISSMSFDALGNKAVMGKTLNKAILSEIIVNVHDKEQRNHIVDVLTKCDDLIDCRKQQLSKLDELVKSRFIEMFGDGQDGKTPVKMLGSICKCQQGTQIPVEEQFEEQLAGYKRFLRIIDYTQAPQPPRYVNVNGKEVDEKSVVIVRYGATAGFVGRGYQGILANNLFEIMPNETMLSKDFLFLALKYGTFEKDVHDKAFGAAMPALSFSMMNGITVVVPTEELQRQFVTFVEQVDKSKVAVQKSLEKLETLKKALMQQYFG